MTYIRIAALIFLSLLDRAAHVLRLRSYGSPACPLYIKEVLARGMLRGVGRVHGTVEKVLESSCFGLAFIARSMGRGKKSPLAVLLYI